MEQHTGARWHFIRDNPIVKLFGFIQLVSERLSKKLTLPINGMLATGNRNSPLVEG